MKRFLLHAITALLAGIILFGIYIAFPASSVRQFFGSVFAVTITTDDLLNRYAASKVNILVVPGHDPVDTGGQYRDMNESDFTLAIGKKVTEYLKTDPRFSVASARNFKTGDYEPQFADYFTAQKDVIRSFRDTLRDRMRNFLSGGLVQNTSLNYHGFANDRISVKLYGINKWANEHNVDLVLHLHLNNYPRPALSQPGQYRGFAIYVPDSQYPNAEASREIAQAVSRRLKARTNVSTLPQEQNGIVEDLDLIAVGSNGSREGASLLIEYGYLYESLFTNPDTRDAILQELAYQTYQGIEDYFRKSDVTNTAHNTTLLPFYWQYPMRFGTDAGGDVLALQSALNREGLYPPPEHTFFDCPMNGSFGPCTEEAVKQFQEKYADDILAPFHLRKGTGIVSGATLRKLNQMFGK